MPDTEDRKLLSTADINDLPDSDFAYIEGGGKKDDEGKTVPRSLRHYPIHDEAHTQNALSRAAAAINAGGEQADIAEKAMPKIKAAAKKFGIEVSDGESKSADEQSEDRADCPTCDGSGTIMDGHRDCPDCNGSGETKSARKPRHSRALALQTKCRRQYCGEIEIRKGVKDAATGADLVELSGQVIGYETPYEVNDMFGSFTETIHRGACEELLSRPNLDVAFLVGHNAAVVPLARTGAKASLELTENAKGLQVRALIDPRMSGAQDLLIGLENGTISQMSVGMQVDPDHDVWSGNDDYGMANKRDIYRLANVFDASAVAFPANPNTALELASARMEEFPPEVTARVQHLEMLAKEGRKGTLNQADSDALLNVIRRLFSSDTERAAPTAQDSVISEAIVAAHQATGAALAAQAKDPDNNSDPADKKVMAHLQAAHAATTDALSAQAKDGTPDDAPLPDQGGADGTLGSPDTSGQDGTGRAKRDIALLLQIDQDALRLSRPPVSV